MPISGRKKIETKFIEAEYGKIQNGVSSKEELEKINRYREVLGLQSYTQAVKMFNELCLIPNGKVIKKQGIDGIIFLKNNGTIQGLILSKEGKYNSYGPTIDNNIILLYILEEYGFTIENIEVADSANFTKNLA